MITLQCGCSRDDLGELILCGRHKVEIWNKAKQDDIDHRQSKSRLQWPNDKAVDLCFDEIPR